MNVWMDDRYTIEINEEIDTHWAELVTEAGPMELQKTEAFLYQSKEPMPVEDDLRFRIEEKTYPVYFRGVVTDPAFDAAYPAEKEILGATRQDGGTVFRVWTPSASSVRICTYSQTYPMHRKYNGTWERWTDDCPHGTPYWYEAEVHGETIRTPDPYAKALTVNSRESVVYFPEGRQSVSERPPLQHTQDAVIYEIHVRDATIHPDSGAENKGTYLGLAEKGTVSPEGYTTGLSYIKELGVTHVELLPVNDFARVDDLAPEKQYNWGYDPLFFQVPEGSYASRPDVPEVRITELQYLIDTFHEEGLHVVLDVVFNHVYVMEESPFEKLVPWYYFRRHWSGEISNGTGVGNDMATERHMVRKFFLDTIDYWLCHFRVDGFRFDLMGALDQETMRQIELRCREEDSPILLLGEGWDLPTALAPDQKTVNTQAGDVPGIRFFNDMFRDSLKGPVFDVESLGYVNGKGLGIERMFQLVKGSADPFDKGSPPHTSEVTQTVNYIECHDNHTLWDKLERSNKGESEEDRRALHQMASGLMLVSQGVPFLHAGQEFYRTKSGDGNSYISPDEINRLDWRQREVHEEDIQFIRSLIDLRRRFDIFRLRTNEAVRKRLYRLQTPAPVFGFMLLDTDRDFCVYANPVKRRQEIELPSPGPWQLLVSNKESRDVTIHSEFTMLEPYEFLVIKKSRR
ncbi:type I pullulanase [Alkalicoccus urumqiensis]|uniref:Type I pullulanase n=1 Tax=Alkalicoccus urumqiensis TaxID=1548213 RepID=A0A2P6MGH4_ALKUR|nr:type I pullulanase [Alkalicoccus urumqiensis]PRO65392.1 type I pullulanase [Alkalicoccus urumqiensis]